MGNQNPRVPPLWEHSLTTLLRHDATSDPGIALMQWAHFQGVLGPAQLGLRRTQDYSCPTGILT